MYFLSKAREERTFQVVKDNNIQGKARYLTIINAIRLVLTMMEICRAQDGRQSGSDVTFDITGAMDAMDIHPYLQLSQMHVYTRLQCS